MREGVEGRAGVAITIDGVEPMIPWTDFATIEDVVAAHRDMILYGNAFAERGDDGKLRRLDPRRFVAWKRES